MNTDTSMKKNEKDTLKRYLKEEIESTRKRIADLKGSLRAEDFNTLNAELDVRSEVLDSLADEDETQLFILRREISLLRENMENLAVKQSWWSKLPVYARILLITVPVVLYLLVMSLIQWVNKAQVYDYPATQTAIATQTVQAAKTSLPISTTTPTAALTQTP